MFDSGTTGFMMVCTMLVFLMTPALAFFYDGLTRRKNVVNTMIMSVSVLGIVGVLWVAVGWSFSYGGDRSVPFFGGFDRMFCQGAVSNLLTSSDAAISHVAHPVIVGIAFQMASAMITAAIITGAVVGRMKFGALAPA